MSIQNTKIALVDDDCNILTSVTMSLEAEGFDVKTYNNGEDAVNGLKHLPADLIVLDIKMPRMDGLSKIRETSRIPAIFLTSKDDEIDELLGLRMGADDYITKPFSQRLLIERIKTILRREEFRQNDNDNSSANDTLIEHGDLIMDKARHIVTWKGQEVKLTVTEFLLLKALAAHTGHVKNRDQLMDYAYGETIYVDDRTIDSHIKRIRKKFGKIDPEFDRIETLYGVGYKYKE